MFFLGGGRGGSVTILAVLVSWSCFLTNLEIFIHTFKKPIFAFKVFLNCSVQGFFCSNLIHLISNCLMGWPSSVFFLLTITSSSFLMDKISYLVTLTTTEDFLATRIQSSEGIQMHFHGPEYYSKILIIKQK